jgi:hypothetical protein
MPIPMIMPPRNWERAVLGFRVKDGARVITTRPVKVETAMLDLDACIRPTTRQPVLLNTTQYHLMCCSAQFRFPSGEKL